MCGIAGIINAKGKLSKDKLQEMCKAIRHRGPDDEGYFLFSQSQGELYAFGEDTFGLSRKGLKDIKSISLDDISVGFGHRRLSIVDISEFGHQPMSIEGITISYNGEIFNYEEIRKVLIDAGYQFQTNGDTEVIIKSYMHWGEDCVNHFNGMWAFAIFDQAKKKVFCSRDRFGIKPFYYYHTEEEIVFGSEIKQILATGVEAYVNEAILFTHLVYKLEDHCRETFFENIFALEPGHSMIIQWDPAIKVLHYRYWELRKDDRYRSLTFEESAKMIGKKLEDSIRLRLSAEVEVGSCLSGGLDSSSIVSLVCRMLSSNEVSQFKTFSACYDGHHEVDERFFSRKIVEDTGCKNFEVKPSGEKIISDFEKLVWHQDEPCGGLSIIASWCVMERASKEGVKVLLDGQGGDETLLGYEIFLLLNCWKIFRILN